MIIRKNFYAIAAFAILVTAAPVFAETTTTPTSQPNKGAWNGGIRGKGNNGMEKPAVFGTVSTISGNIITVTSKQGMSTNATTTTFTVDATNAKITKNKTTGTISSIIVGDKITVQGTVSGTNVVATAIRDEIMQGVGNKTNQKVPAIAGNGQPVVAGTVSSVNGSTIIITNKSNVNYTIDATNAKIVQGQNTILTSNIAVGDTVIVQGTVNGNSVIASSINDQVKTVSTTSTGQPQKKGFFSGIGSFFGRIFGF